MLKKFYIVVICVVTIVAVFGLNDRLDYDGITTAANSISASALDMADDLEYLEALAGIVQNFDPAAEYVVGGVQQPDGSYTVVIDIIRADPLSVTTITFNFRDEYDAKRLIDTLNPLTWGQGGINDPFDDDDSPSLLKSIGLVLVIIMVVILLVLNLLFDSVAVAMSIVNACFYLIGF